jgi:hypothetical protein
LILHIWVGVEHNGSHYSQVQIDGEAKDGKGGNTDRKTKQACLDNTGALLNMFTKTSVCDGYSDK